ncbi:MAG: 50S ribosomal protein L15 [Simkaniaceae bacterium]|nr:50S ribosomal protein L15 [Simkaniaceae bacterium]
MMKLSELTNSNRKKQKVQRVGRGPGSNRGKTCSRGHKGQKARSGYKRREGKEGGQLPLYQKLPCRGFSNAQFKTKVFSINLDLIEQLFNDGEVVNVESLTNKGFNLRRINGGIKILGNGELSKKVSIESHAISASAKIKLEKSQVPFTIIPKK